MDISHDKQLGIEPHIDGEDATFMAEADFLAEGLGKGPTFATDGIFLSNAILEEMKSNPSKYFENCDPASMKPVTMDDSQ
ncbi:MAG: hypothetical protein IKQ17_05230 [Kiritimatiellae bacterium]|nr:hypothetical protein [Kiritimatiellia bacterium]